MGIEKTKAFARKTVFWPGLNKQIEDMIENCNTCLSYRNKNTKEPMILKEIPSGPWEIISADIFKFKGKFYLLIVDSYSKYVEVEMLNNLHSTHIIDVLKKTFSRFGMPKEVYSDSGSQFISHVYKSFSNEWNLKFKITSPKHHEANGLAERYIETVKRMFYKIVQEKRDISLALLQYRNTPINETGATPTELLFGRSTRNLIPFCNNKTIDLNKYKESLINKQLKQKEYFDRGARTLNPLKEGDIVKIHHEHRVVPHRNGIITKKATGPRSYYVKTEEGTEIVRNRKFLSKGKNFNITKSQMNDDIDINASLPINHSSSNFCHELNNNKNCNDQSKNNQDQNVIAGPVEHRQTRSGRAIKMPDRYNDYVLNKINYSIKN